MVGRQLERIAYGRPDYGGLVIGGESAGLHSSSGGYTLNEDLEVSWDGERLTVNCSFWVHGYEATDLETRIALLKALTQDLGNFGWTGADALSIACTYSSPDGSNIVTITATSGTPFLAAHLGLPIEISGLIGFQITEVTSTTVVKCKLPAGHPLFIGAAATAKIGVTLGRTDEATKTFGFNGRGKVRAVSDPEEEPLRRKFTLELQFEQPASYFRGSDKDRVSGKIRRLDPIGGARVVEFSGSFTAASSQAAFTRYTDQIGAWITANMTAILGGGVGWEKVGADRAETEDNGVSGVNGNTLTFSLTRKEINVDQSDTLNDDPALADANITLTPRQSFEHGVSGSRPPTELSVEYSCEIVRAQLTSTGAILEKWFSTIVPRLLSIVRAFYGSQIIIDGMSGPAFNPITRRLTGGLACTLPDTGSSITLYRRVVTFQLLERKKYREVQDGEEFSAIESSIGRAVLATTSAQIEELEGVSGGGGPSLAGGGGLLNQGAIAAEFGFFGQSNGPLVSFDDAPSGGGNDGPGGALTYRPLDPPSPAPAYFAKFGITLGEGEWRHQGTAISEDPVSRGNDPRGLSATATKRLTTITRGWRWVSLKGAAARGGPASSAAPPSTSKNPNMTTDER